MIWTPLSRSFSRPAAWVAAAAAIGCAAPGGAPRLGEEKSFDGLLRVENARAGAVWMRRDFDVSGYAKVRFVGAGVEFRPVRASATQRAVPVSEAQEARLLEILSDAFRDELARSKRFALVDESGPDALTLWVGLLDVVSYVPPQPSGRGDVFLRSLGEATLVVELRDSLSHASLARVMDRRAIERSDTTLRANTVTTWSEVRRVARSWARIVVTRLDDSVDWKLAAE